MLTAAEISKHQRYRNRTGFFTLRFFFCCIALLLLTPGSAAFAASIDEVRTRFYRAIEHESTAESLFSELSSEAVPGSPLLYAYLGAVETLLGKHAYNPYTKWKHLQNGLQKIAESIRRQPENIEIRFLRFSILHYIPGFLGFSSERDEDCAALYRLFMQPSRQQDLPPKLYRNALEFVINSGRLNDAQSNNLRKMRDVPEKR